MEAIYEPQGQVREYSPLARPREKNGNWRGGRTIASNGYVLIRVGTDHHLADIRGYAYEHRLVAESVLGRQLESGEIVHHRNGDKQDNRADNLEVAQSIAHHKASHRRKSGRRSPGQASETICCACGCGALLQRFDQSGRPRRYISGHNRRKSGEFT